MVYYLDARKLGEETFLLFVSEDTNGINCLCDIPSALIFVTELFNNFRDMVTFIEEGQYNTLKNMRHLTHIYLETNSRWLKSKNEAFIKTG